MRSDLGENINQRKANPLSLESCCNLIYCKFYILTFFFLRNTDSFSLVYFSIYISLISSFSVLFSHSVVLIESPWTAARWASLSFTISQSLLKLRPIESVMPSHRPVLSSVAQSCLTLCDPMNLSTPGLPVHHQLPEPTQTHVR